MHAYRRGLRVVVLYGWAMRRPQEAEQQQCSPAFLYAYVNNPNKKEKTENRQILTKQNHRHV